MKRTNATMREPCLEMCPGAPRKRTSRPRNRRNYNYSTKRVTYVTRTCEKSAINFVGQIWSNRNYVFRLSDLPQYTEFTALYDQYKIEKVKLQFFPRFSENISPIGTNPIWTNALIWNCSSDDGTVRLATENDALQAMSAKMRVTNDPITVWVKPKFQVEAATALAFSAAAPRTGWLDCDNFGVTHSGHEIAGYNMGAGAGQISEWKCYATYYIAFKDVK